MPLAFTQEDFLVNIIFILCRSFSSIYRLTIDALSSFSNDTFQVVTPSFPQASYPPIYYIITYAKLIIPIILFVKAKLNVAYDSLLKFSRSKSSFRLS